MNGEIHIIGGGTLAYVRPLLAITTPVFGSTGRKLKTLLSESYPKVTLHNTQVAGGSSELATNEDVIGLFARLKDNPNTKIIIVTAALLDFAGEVEAPPGRLKTSDGEIALSLVPVEGPVDQIRNTPDNYGLYREDLFLVTFKATTGKDLYQQMYEARVHMERTRSHIVFANDFDTRRCVIVTTDKEYSFETYDRDVALRRLVYLIGTRHHLIAPPTMMRPR